MKSVSLILPLPPSTNALFANVPGKGRVRTTAYVRWANEAQASLWMQKPKGGFPLFDGAYYLHVEVPLKLRSDIDNSLKPISDFLQKPAGIITNDKYADRVSISRSEKVDPGFCKVHVIEARADG